MASPIRSPEKLTDKPDRTAHVKPDKGLVQIYARVLDANLSLFSDAFCIFSCMFLICLLYVLWFWNMLMLLGVGACCHAGNTPKMHVHAIFMCF